MGLQKRVTLKLRKLEVSQLLFSASCKQVYHFAFMPQNSKAQLGFKKGNGRRNRRAGSSKQQVSKFAGDAYSLGVRALAGVKHLASLINIETKYFTKYTSTNITNSPVISCQSLIPQGVDNGNRVGDSIRIQSLSFQYVVNIINASTINNFVRLMVVRDLQNPGADFVAADLLNLATVSYISDINYFNKDRFTILYDRTIYLSNVNDDSMYGSFTKGESGHIKYRGSATTSASNAEGALYLVAGSNALSNYPTLESVMSITYTDD